VHLIDGKDLPLAGHHLQKLHTHDIRPIWNAQEVSQVIMCVQEPFPIIYTIVITIVYYDVVNKDLFELFVVKNE
jgi:hypothetical protein